MKLDNTRLLVNDFPTTFLFYRDVLGFTPSYGNENDVYTQFTTAGSTFTLFKRPLMQEALVDSASPIPDWIAPSDSFALIFEVDDIDSFYGELNGKGVQFIAEPQDRPVWGIRTAHLRDPEGNLVEFFSPLKI